MTPRRRFARPMFAAGVLALSALGAGCSSSSSSPDTTAASVAADALPTATDALPTGSDALPTGAEAAQEIAVVFDSPGADPRPLQETAVSIGAPIDVLRMRVTDLTYRGVVCGFTFSGTRPASPVTIRVEGTTATGGFTSGPVELRWYDDGTTSADSPASDNGWSFSADSYSSRNGPGWAVSIGGVTAEGENVNPNGVTCELRSRVQFVPENGPVGYWAGFATR